MVVLRGRGCAGSGVRKFRNRIAVLHRLEVFRFGSFGSGWFLHGRRSCANAGSTVVRAAMRDICFMIMTRKISVTLTSGKQICQFSGFLLPSLRLFGRLRPYAGTPGGTVRRHSLRLRSDTCRPGRVHRAGYARHRRRRTVHVPRQRGGRGLLRSGRGESRTQPGRAPGEVEAGGCGVYGSGRLKAVVRAVGACGEPSRRDSRLHARSLEKTGPSGVRRCPLIRIREQSGFKLQSFDFCGILRVVRGKGEIIFSLRGEICDFFRCNSRKYVKNSN